MARIKKTAKSEKYFDMIKKSDNLSEANDCTVKAIALACDVSYEAAHTALKTFGRKHGRGTSISIMEKACRMLGFKMVYVDRDHFIKQYPKAHQILKSITTHHPERFNKIWKDGHNYIHRS
jgi:hypothetical protein